MFDLRHRGPTLRKAVGSQLHAATGEGVHGGVVAEHASKATPSSTNAAARNEMGSEAGGSEGVGGGKHTSTQVVTKSAVLRLMPVAYLRLVVMIWNAIAVTSPAHNKTIFFFVCVIRPRLHLNSHKFSARILLACAV
jgi:hypothetical protein